LLQRGGKKGGDAFSERQQMDWVLAAHRGGEKKGKGKKRKSLVRCGDQYFTGLSHENSPGGGGKKKKKEGGGFL